MGEESSAVATLYGALGMVNRTQGNYAKAVELFEKSLVIQLKMSKELDIATTFNNLGAVYGLPKKPCPLARTVGPQSCAVCLQHQPTSSRDEMPWPWLRLLRGASRTAVTQSTGVRVSRVIRPVYLCLLYCGCGCEWRGCTQPVSIAGESYRRPEMKTNKQTNRH
jgi:hypothetical protein